MKFQAMLGGICLGLALAGQAAAGTITMELKCILDGTNLIMQVLNTGDEAAQNIVGKVDFNGTTVMTPPLTSLPPSKPRGVPVGLALEGLRGLYPVVVTVNFEDLNGYPFSTVSVLQVPAADAQRSELLAVMDETAIRGKTPVALRIRNEKAAAITARYRLIIPRELVAEQITGEVEIPANGRVSVPLLVENFSALPNSRYGLHAVIEYDDDGRHYTSVASTPVRVLPPRVGRNRFFWVAVIVVVTAIAGSFFFWRPSKSEPSAP